MDVLFLKLLNMSIAAGWLVLVIVLLRFLLKRAPKWIACALWAMVALRLLCPFSLESVLSLIPSAETVSPQILYAQEPTIHSGVPAINSALNPVISGSFAPSPEASVNPLQLWTTVAAYVWLAGLAAMLLYAAVSFLRLRKRVGASLSVRGRVWICDDIKTPFILGVIKPRIYLPSGMEEAQQAQVIAHESAHLQRRDHWWKPLGFLLLAFYWFNPLCWLAYILLCRDIELACDEKVIRTMEKSDLLAYSEALLTCSVPRRQLSACPLAFGEVGVKERVKAVLNYKKPAFWIIVVAVLACVAVAVCFLTNPKTGEKIKWAERPTLVIDGVSYIDPYMPVSEPPYGYALAGTLSEEQANDTELAGCKYYTHPDDTDSFFVFERCGTPIDENTVDSEKLQWAYVRWIREGLEESYARLLTLDAVRFLAKKGNALTWSNFDKYSHIETGSGLYIRVYEIDERFSLMIGGGSTDESPLYIRLVSKANQDDYIDIRTEDVEAFIAAHSSFASSVGGADTYMYSSTVYMNPASSYFPVGTTGYLYRIFENDELVILSEETGETFASVSGAGLAWSPLPIDDWKALFVVGDAPDISGIHQPLVMKLSDKYYLFDMDGGLWLGEYGGEKNGMWSVYELKSYEAEQNPAAAGVLLTITASGSTVTPYQNPIWAQSWEDAGWLTADGLRVIYTLPEIAGELPTVTLSDDFQLSYGANASFCYLSIFDESYERIYHNAMLDQLNTLPAGTYYISVTVSVQGAYIEAGKDYEAMGYECVCKFIVPADPLDAAISAAILEHNKGDYKKGDFACESHVTLATVSATPKAGERGHEVIVYAMVLYQEYGFSGASFHEVSGSHIPTALTFEVDADGTHMLTEYWTPRDGSYYVPDIRERFPADIAEDALDAQKYILAQTQSCYAQAVEYGKVDTDAAIGQLLEAITSSPGTSSNPGDYIDAHPIEYRELTYYGDYTLRYIFSEFLQGGQTGLRGHILRSVMDDLIGGEGLGPETATGQEYFDAWREHTERVYEQNGAAYMQESCPKGWLLLQMLG